MICENLYKIMPIKLKSNTGTHSLYSINTGSIYTNLCNQWDELPRVIFEQIEWKLKTILLQKKLITVAFSKKMRKYIDGQKNALITIKEESKDPTNPPFTNYFVHPHGNEGFDLMAYNENCMLEYEADADFDFFFALKLLVLDLMKFDEFLVYHYTTNFKSDSKKYKSFFTKSNC